MAGEEARSRAAAATAQPVMLARLASGLRDLVGFGPGEWHALLRDLGLSVDRVADEEGHIPLENGFALFEEVARRFHRPALGIEYAQALEVGTTGPLGFAVVSAGTVGDALRIISRFLPLTASLQFCRYEQDETAGTVVWQYPRCGVEPSFQFVSLGVAVTMSRIGPAMPAGWKPLEVVFGARPPRLRSVVEQAFGPGLRFENGRGFRFSVQAELLSRPLPTANPRLFALMTRLAEIEQQSRLAYSSEFESTARHALLQLLQQGKFTLGDLAEALTLSPSQLRSRLKSHGLAFRSLIDDVRRTTARSYLMETELSMTEIAFSLGYSDSSIFTRACRKWFGQAPRDVRARAIGR